MSSFSVLQRGADFADLAVPHYRDPATQRLAQVYQVERASNWDAAFAPLITLNLQGMRSRGVSPLRAGSAGSGAVWRNRIRWVFDPADYSLTDSEVQWLQITPVLPVEVPPLTPAPAGPILALLPAGLYRQAYFPFVLTGTTPVTPVVLRLPRTSTSLVIRAVSGTSVVGLGALGVSLNSITVTSGGALSEYSNNNINFDTLTLSGGGEVEISMALGSKIA